MMHCYLECFRETNVIIRKLPVVPLDPIDVNIEEDTLNFYKRNLETIKKRLMLFLITHDFNFSIYYPILDISSLDIL